MSDIHQTAAELYLGETIVSSLKVSPYGLMRRADIEVSTLVVTQQTKDSHHPYRLLQAMPDCLETLGPLKSALTFIAHSNFRIE